MTTTPQAALLISDLELRAIYEKHQLATADIVISDLRRILIDAQSAIIAKLQATQAEPTIPGLTKEQFGYALHCAQAIDAATSEIARLRSENAALNERLDATQEPVQTVELPDEREAFEKWASDNGEFPRAVARSGDVYHLMATQTYWLAWQARAALSARKPLTPLTPDQIEAEFDKRNAELERVGHGTDVPSDLWDFSIGAHFGIQEFCRINGIGLEVKP